MTMTQTQRIWRKHKVSSEIWCGSNINLHFDILSYAMKQCTSLTHNHSVNHAVILANKCLVPSDCRWLHQLMKILINQQINWELLILVCDMIGMLLTSPVPHGILCVEWKDLTCFVVCFVDSEGEVSDSIVGQSELMADAPQYFDAHAPSLRYLSLISRFSNFFSKNLMLLCCKNGN